MTRTRLTSSLIPLLLATSASAGDFNLNVYTTLPSYTGCEDPLYDAIDQGACTDLVSSPIEFGAFVWIVVSETDDFPDGIGGVQFGLEHNLPSDNWTFCTGGSEIPTADWPASGSGNAITWESGCYDPAGGNAKIGYIALNEGNVGQVAITRDPRVSTTFIADCSIDLFSVCEANLGSLDLSVGGTPVCGQQPGPGPNPATNCTAGPIACAIEVAWEFDVTGGGEIGGFRVLRDGDVVGQAGSHQRSFTDFGAVPGPSYAYSVVAFNGCAAAAPSNEATAMVVPDTESATNCTATTGECNQIIVNWEHAGGAASFDIYRDGSLRDTVGGSNRTYFDLAIDQQTYTYEIVSVGCVETEPSNPADGSAVFPPARPTDLVAESLSCGGDIRLAWIDQSDNETGFEVFRGLTPGTAELYATVGADVTEFVDTDTEPEVVYAYLVRAINACGGSLADGPVEGEVLSPPATPVDCAATSACTAIRVTWVELSGVEEVVEVWRDGGLLASLPPDTEEYLDEDVVLAEPHTYFVRVTNACGESGPSNEATAELEPVLGPTTLVSPPDGADCIDSPVTLRWDALPGAVAYVVETGAVCGEPLTETTTSDLSLIVPVDGEVTWWVRAIDGNGCVGERSECRSLTASPVLPGTFLDANPIAELRWEFTWSAVPGATSYVLRIADGCMDPYSATEYVTTETQLTLDTPLYFEAWVTAVNSCGDEGDPSNCAGPGTPVPVLLQSFRAAPSGPDIVIEWRTGAETGVAGFHLWRAVDGSEAFTRIHDGRITTDPSRAYRFVDDDVVAGVGYVYRLMEETVGGADLWLGEARASAAAAGPARVSLTSAPNPFNPRTTLSVQLPEATVVDLTVYDAAGRAVRRLARSLALGAGDHRWVWDGRDDSGAAIASGTYFARLRGAGFDVRHRVVLLR